MIFFLCLLLCRHEPVQTRHITILARARSPAEEFSSSELWRLFVWRWHQRSSDLVPRSTISREIVWSPVGASAPSCLKNSIVNFPSHEVKLVGVELRFQKFLFTSLSLRNHFCVWNLFAWIMRNVPLVNRRPGPLLHRFNHSYRKCQSLSSRSPQCCGGGPSGHRTSPMWALLEFSGTSRTDQRRQFLVLDFSVSYRRIYMVDSLVGKASTCHIHVSILPGNSFTFHIRTIQNCRCLHWFNEIEQK